MNYAVNTHTQTKTRPVNTQSTLSRITEVIIPQKNNSQQIIFPLVASMTQTQEQHARWTTWITDCKPSAEQLKQFGANTETLRIIHIDKNNDNRWILWEALSKGTSSTIIGDIGCLNTQDIQAFESAANLGVCAGIIIRSA